jgi:hypothetical protein
MLTRPTVVPGLGGARLPWESSAARGEPLYYAHGWTDANYYQGAAAAAPSARATIRLVARLLSLPATTQRICAAHIAATQSGWRIQTGNGTTDSISVIMGNAGWAETPRHVFVAGDVGDLFVLHAWVDGSLMHLAIGGAEVGAGTAFAGALGNPAEAITLGRYPHAGGFANQHVGIVSLCTSPTAITLPQVAADAAAIMSSGTRLVLPRLPGEDMRYVAADALAGPWAPRTGSSTLTENGSVTVTAVP